MDDYPNRDVQERERRHRLLRTARYVVREQGRFYRLRQYGFKCACGSASGAAYDSRPAARLAHRRHVRDPQEPV